ncbi:MAG: FAD:protein FMN transferase [Lachnospiraceae bacterium]|nr:FAD:protein FMN transferase [Lachnospiraceae bacterium]
MSFNGCQKAPSPVTKTGVYFDTVISITLYERNSSKLIDDCFALADNYDALLSKTNNFSDVSKVNNSCMEWVQINPETFSIIERSMTYEDLSDGHFSVMCGALTDLWDISGKSSIINNSESNISLDEIIPSKDDIEQAIKLCGKATIDLDASSNSVRINTPGAKLDLGAVAKGYIADKMKEYLVSNGVTSGIIQLGGNVLLIGENPLREDGCYNIGITKPFSDDNASDNIITGVSEKDTSIVTSGNYQRYFKYNDKIYHHIIDLKTGYPADNNLNSVAIITDTSYDADALSTVAFIYGKKNGPNFIESLNKSDIKCQAIFIDNSNNILQ